LIVEEILSERSNWGDANVSERGAYLGKLHVRIDNRAESWPKIVNLFTKWCEQNTLSPDSYSQVIRVPAVEAGFLPESHLIRRFEVFRRRLGAGNWGRSGRLRLLR
jgi:hypothetical protein